MRIEMIVSFFVNEPMSIEAARCLTHEAKNYFCVVVEIIF